MNESIRDQEYCVLPVTSDRDMAYAANQDIAYATNRPLTRNQRGKQPARDSIAGAGSEQRVVEDYFPRDRAAGLQCLNPQNK